MCPSPARPKKCWLRLSRHQKIQAYFPHKPNILSPLFQEIRPAFKGIFRFRSLWITRMRAASPRLLRLLCHKPLCQHHHCTVNHLSLCFSFYFLFWITNHGANKAQTGRRTRLPLASPGASASLCQYCPSHWGQESLWSKISSTQEQHAASQHFASTRAPYGHDCLGNVMLLCISGQLQHKSTEHKIMSFSTIFSFSWH